MIILNRQVDEPIVIGEALRVTPTDIDSAGVRVQIKGEQVGGPDDGLAVNRTQELAIGSSVRIGTLVNVTLLKVSTDAPRRAQFGIQVPPKLVVQQSQPIDRPAEDA